MKQLITASASLILILTIFVYSLDIQKINFKKTECKLCSLKYISLVKEKGRLTDEIEEKWQEHICKIYGCDREDLDFRFDEEVISDEKIIDVNINVNIFNSGFELKSGLSESSLEIKNHFIIKCVVVNNTV